jgi:5-methylcytosine-specific restriction endonuclease McrBC regulatory subunit McrC
MERLFVSHGSYKQSCASADSRFYNIRDSAVAGSNIEGFREELLDEVQDVAVSADYARATPIGRGSRHLESLKQWAVIFLSRKTLDVRGHAKGQQGAGLMFRMWDVYERYAINQLNKTLAEVGKKAGCRLYAVGQKQTWKVATYEDAKGTNEAFTLKPDILIYRDDKPIMIADTKWKVLNDAED